MRKTRDNLLFIIIAFVLITVGGCRQHDDDDPTVVRMGAGDFNITLSAEPYPENTKISQFAPAAIPLEDAIFNLHVFLIPLHTNAGTGPSSFDTDARHYYFEFDNPYMPGQIKLDRVFFGKYKIYLLANNGKTLLDQNSVEIFDLDQINTIGLVENIKLKKISYPYKLDLDSKSGIPMSAYCEDWFGQNPNTEYAFSLTRLMSKTFFGNEIQINEPNFKLESLKLINVVETIKPFVENFVPENFRKNNVDLPKEHNVNDPYYLLYNIQPTPDPITPNVINRTAKYAPANSTYLSIGGKYDGKDGENTELDFSVYFGDENNNPNDYNLHPNGQYMLNVEFNDLSNIENDPRISHTILKIEQTDFTKDKPTALSPNTNYKLKIKIEYKNVFADVLKLSSSVSADVELQTRESIIWSTTINNNKTEHTQEISQYEIPIKSISGQGEILIDLNFKYTKGSGGDPGVMNIGLSNLRKSFILNPYSITFED